MMILKVVTLVCLIKVLLETDKPLLCAGIYTSVGVLLALAFGRPFLDVLMAGIVGFALAAVYFWLLERFRDNFLLWCTILAAGLLIGLV